jgi:HSP20 family protein
MAMERWHQPDRWEPFRNVSDIQGEMNRLFDVFLGRPLAGAAPSGRMWMPPIDMAETDDELILTVEIPGVREKDVSVSITGDLLSIKGHRRPEDDATDRKSLHVERLYGHFERMIQLPLAVQGDRVKATYRDGVLQISLPKADQLKPRQIKIDIV